MWTAEVAALLAAVWALGSALRYGIVIRVRLELFPGRREARERRAWEATHPGVQWEDWNGSD
jgi:hypothetical protein